VEAPNDIPDPIAFPGWVRTNYFTSTTQPANVANAYYIDANAQIRAIAKTNSLLYVLLVRGGV
jgi:hypothetical protein